MPAGLGMALGVIALLMVLAFVAVKYRDCREQAAMQGESLDP